MYLILFLVGIVMVFAGAMLIISAVPVVDVAAAALFTSGIVAIVGGLILFALAAAVRVLARIAERLEIQPLPVPAVASVAHEDPAPRPVRSALTPGAASATKRPSLLSWFGRQNAAAVADQKEPTPPAEPVPPPVDLAPLTRVPEEPKSASPLPPSVAPPPATPAPVAAPPVAAPPIPRPAPPLRPAARPAPAGTPEGTVYKSGVIDGMAYTLFMDGAIEAELPQGRVRFASVDELQKYLTTRQ